MLAIPFRAGRFTAPGFLLASAALVCLAGTVPATAQERGEPTFTPTLFVLGSTTNDEFRTGGEPIGDSSLYAELELPFTFSGPRWSGGFSLNPAVRRYRELRGLDDFDSSIDGWLRGELSRRTRVVIDLGVARSAQLTGLDGTDLVTSRADRVRSRASAGLTHELNTAGDSIDARAQFDMVEYLDGEFVSERSYAVELGYARALDPRLSFYVGGGAGRFEYDGGGAVHTLSPRAGFAYRVGPRTDLRVRGGVSFVSGDAVGIEDRTLDGRTVTAEAGLSHSGRSWGLGLTAGRDVASGVALGEPTLRTRITGSVDWGDPRWRLGVSAGLARNEALLDDNGRLLLVSADGLIATEADSVDTYSVCVDAGFRFTDWMSLVGSGRLVDQQPQGGDDSLRLDVYRFSVGVAVHPYAGPVKSTRGAGVLRRYGRAGSIGSC